MVLLRILGVGRLRPSFRAAADDYLRRLRRYVRVEEVEIRAAASEGNPVAARRVEAERLRRGLPPGARTVALTREGTPWSSIEVARRLRRWREGTGPVAFLIGGATGLDPGLRAAADDRWSLGPLTLPHELARVVVLEQLYRAAAILAGHPYHQA